MFTRSEENYLKAIFHLQADEEDGVSTNSLADSLATKAASVTEMIKKLASKNLVSYKKYYGVTLTKKGAEQALKVIRKHRLWESFLVERLNFNWDEVHDVAEQLEHIKSEKLVDAIDKLLDYPKVDPHGDPIPCKDGTFPKETKLVLSECEVGSKGIIVGVKDSSSVFLKYLDKQKIGISSKFEIKDKEAFDEALDIKIDGEALKLSAKMAANLFVKVL
ncbi:metal-dependent transcriptional regulator [Aequorivita marina]|uniref:metal-dependent transcriptional regulator n=1 Tax=Aequorivita marina TaxID=3073654 RepID=UPI002876546D|nr:metal-dependent transcriptional regulator [Aequorivita sp. S2608]MDS1297489.1 metal-dependent transcriptional regulator [Aequorivita sp. S2608]